MENVEALQLETYRLLGYEKNVAKQAQQKQQFLQRRVSLLFLTFVSTCKLDYMCMLGAMHGFVQSVDCPAQHHLHL